MKSRIVNIIAIAFLFSACGAQIQQQGSLDQLAAIVATPTPTYDCTYYNEYSSLSACYTATSANCSFGWKTFPSGGLGICYKPVDGWESCAATPGVWVYASGSVYDTGTDDGGGNPIIIQNFSIVKCSSDVCLCTQTPVLKKTCSYGVDPDCPVPQPTPTVTPSPTPNKFFAYAGYDCTQLDNPNFDSPTQYLAGPNKECDCTSGWDATSKSWPLTCACKLDTTICSPGLVDNAANTCKCEFCGNGYASSQVAGALVCTACGPGTSTGGDMTAASCASCSTGSYSSGANNVNCTPCTNVPSGAVSATYTGTGATSNNCSIDSVNCIPGYGNGGTTCTGCTAGTKSLGGAAPCSSCGVDTSSGALATECTACNNGEYAPGGGVCTACTNRPANASFASYNGKGNGANQCPYASVTCNSSYAWNGVTSFGGALCAACATGTWSSGGSACAACTNNSAGRYWTSNGTSATGCGDAACTNNTTGFYWTTHGGTSSTGCTNTACTNKQGSSTYNSHGGSTNTCGYDCSSGYGSSACTQCGVDTRDATVGGQEACSSCSPGQYSAVGSTSCSTCNNMPALATAATYSGTGGGLNQCPYSSVSCPAAYEWNSVSTFAGAACTACAIGEWSGAGGSCAACTNSTTGEYWTSNGTTATGCATTACTNKLGTSTYTGHGGTTNSCTYACNSGYGSSACTACAAGTWDSIVGGQDSCTSCVGGYSTGAANASCTSCSNAVVGTAGSGATSIVYADGNTTATCNFSSFSCPANSTWNGSFVGGVAACNCDGGFNWDGDSCEPSINCYQDADNDGYTVSTPTVYAGASCPLPAGTTGAGLKPLSAQTDCCDSAANTNPGQSSYFTTTNACGNWDYNCSGSLETNSYNNQIGTGLTNSGSSWKDPTNSCHVSDSHGYVATAITATTAHCGTSVYFRKNTPLSVGGGSSASCTDSNCMTCSPYASGIFTEGSTAVLNCH